MAALLALSLLLSLAACGGGDSGGSGGNDATASTMIVGIRGTCGWVEERDGLSRVYVLEGKVNCSVGGRMVRVNAGEMGSLTADGELVVEPFGEPDLPAFVRDPGLCGDIYEASGQAGENVTWSYSNGVLTIGGTGPMYDYYVETGDDDWYEFMEQPWRAYYREINTIIIENGVTTIGGNAFGGNGGDDYQECAGTNVTIPASVTSVGYAAFFGCGDLTVYYAGTESQWAQISIAEGDAYENGALVNATIHFNSTGN